MSRLAHDVVDLTLEERREQSVEVARETIDEVRVLLALPVWKKIIAFGEEQLAAREPATAGPLESLLDLPRHEYIRGEASGINLMLSAPLVLQRVAEELIELKKEENE